MLLGDFNIYAEMQLLGAGLKFMDAMAAIGLSQHFMRPTRVAAHTLDLVFMSVQVEDYLKMMYLEFYAFPGSDYLLLRFGFHTTITIDVEGELVP